MKQTKKTALKESKKLAKKDLENQLANALKSVVGTVKEGQKKVDSIIAKNTKQLAKKLSKYIGTAAPLKNAEAEVITKLSKKTTAKTKVEEEVVA